MKYSGKKWLTAWWLGCGSLLLLAACGGGDGIATLDTRFTASLTGAQEVPPTSSAATGTGTATLNPITRELTATINTTGVAGTAAHIHEAPRGVSGPVIFPLTQTTARSGVWTTTVTLTEAQADTLRAGNFYFNVHSAAFPAGEIRGQIEDEKFRSGSTTTTVPTSSTTSTVTTTTTP